MTEDEFRSDLPTATSCDGCGAMLGGIAWNVVPFTPGQWCGVGLTKCEACQLVRVAAAGSNDNAHDYARSVRARFIASINS